MLCFCKYDCLTIITTNICYKPCCSKWMRGAMNCREATKHVHKNNVSQGYPWGKNNW